MERTPTNMKNHWLARHLATFATIAFLVFGMLAAAGTPASANSNGDVKIRTGASVAGEPAQDEGNQNEPFVCSPFHLHGFNFDPASSGQWWIDVIPPTSNPSAHTALSGSWGSAPGGEWINDNLSLSDGHYKLYYKQAGDTLKHKVFWVKCGEVPPPPPPCANGIDFTLSLTGAGKSQPSYDAFVNGTYKVRFYFVGDQSGSFDASSVIDGDNNPATLADLTIVGSTLLNGPSATITSWSYTIGTTLGGSEIWNSGSIPVSITMGIPDCAGSDSAISPVSSVTIFKAADLTGAGGATDLDTGLPGFTFTATSGTTVLHSGTSDSNGSAQIAGLDDFATWTICEDAHDGYVQTTPASGGCYTLGAGSTPATDYVFGNFKTVNLTVAKDATPTFTRSFDWTTAKTVDHALVDTATNATFTYSVTATKGPAQDSAWAISGTITVTNPNPIPVNVTLTDGSCTLTNASLTVLANDSAQSDYSCSFGSGASGTNTATATWDNTGAMAGTGPSADSNAVAYAFVTPTTVVDDSATITDSFAGTLGTTSATTTYSYTRTIAATANQCVSYGNTATTTEGTSGQTSTASRSVTVCGRNTGGLTIGYWQNKNGQAQITGGGAALKTYVMGFAPFQDIGTTQTVAAYATNVIKAANASGASMNAMLKAQMLSTALSAYFTPSLGTKNIDLTNVCKNIALCTISENTSSSFNGATSSTVNALLAYAASRSNVGGTSWYGQLKSGLNSQELAKDTFDAINNNVAFVAP
jgi:hypothetical protein